MGSLFTGPGFLGTRTPPFADASLAGIYFSILLLLLGWQLRIRRRSCSHGLIQSIAVILQHRHDHSGSFLKNILPALPSKMRQTTNALTTRYALLGTASAAPGIFIILRVNNLVPQMLRFDDYKRYIRTGMILYLWTAVMGIVVYHIFYVAIP